MTGFGRAMVQESGVQITVEILSVNRKHLDINLVLPKHLNRFDPDIRKQVGAFVMRGHVTVRISVVFVKDSPLKVQANLAMAKQYHQGWCAIAESLGLDNSSFCLSLLENETDLFVYNETESMNEFAILLNKGIDKALKPFIAMRESEGELLKKDIDQRLDDLKIKMTTIAQISPQAVEKYRNKMIEKMKSLIPSIEVLDERLLKEIALFAEKVDVEEEIVRFYSHIDQFKQLLKNGPPAAGKTAEFLVQEITREINTTGSKCSDLTVTKLVVDIKSELERIREQIQNIE